MNYFNNSNSLNNKKNNFKKILRSCYLKIKIYYKRKMNKLINLINLKKKKIRLNHNLKNK